MGLTENLEKPTTDTPVRMQDKKEKPLTKVIIRRLPPTITQETFLNQVSPVPDYDHIYTVGGDASLGEYSFARVYISFVNPDDVFTFKEKFDNYVFVDTKGHEYPAVVEFAAFQRIPKKRNKQKTDPKCGTIENDPVYLEFLEMLKQQPESEEKPEFSLQLTTGETKADVTTPLLEYIKQRRVEKQRIKEERREERKRREFERRKVRDDDRRKHFADKSPIAKPNVAKKEEEEVVVEKAAVFAGGFKNKDKKFEERRGFVPKTKYPAKPEKKEYYEKKMEFKNRRGEFKGGKYQEDVKKPEDPKAVKKVKKYSERREERKHGTKVNEAKTEKEETIPEEKNLPVETATCETKNENVAAEVKEKEQQISKETTSTTAAPETSKNKENDPRLQRRIRNKDRPAMAIYQPGMLSKRKQAETTSGDDTKQCNKSKE